MLRFDLHLVWGRIKGKCLGNAPPFFGKQIKTNINK